jgi:OFA family oxalate/formate antiporter-like MFS transporter
MALACMGGLMMIGFAKPIAVAKGLGETATIGVLVISMCNSFGRLTWGVVADKLGPKKTILVLLIGSGVLSILVNNANGYFIYVLIGLIGFFYGGFLSNYPTLTAVLFGPTHMATNYGMVLTGFGLGAVVSSYIAGHYKNVAAQDISLMTPAFIIAAGCALVSVVLVLLVKTKAKKA